MSGSRTRQLRKECARRLGRAPYDAEGHVSMRSVTATKKVGKRTVLQRFWALLKNRKALQVDEFRFFKRHHCTPAEATEHRRRELAASRAHEQEVERNNRRMGIID